MYSISHDVYYEQACMIDVIMCEFVLYNIFHQRNYRVRWTRKYILQIDTPLCNIASARRTYESALNSLIREPMPLILRVSSDFVDG